MEGAVVVSVEEFATDFGAKVPCWGFELSFLLCCGFVDSLFFSPLESFERVAFMICQSTSLRAKLLDQIPSGAVEFHRNVVLGNLGKQPLE